MKSTALFELGTLEVSSEAAEVLAGAEIDPEVYFDRHRCGDWGDVPDWLRGDNDRAAHSELYSHAIRSHYLLSTETELLLVTATDRSRTRLQLAHEFREREVAVQDGYAIWAASYENPNPLIAVEQPVVEGLLLALPCPGRAIDVGTGTGRLARMIARRGARSVLGVDATEEMLSVARTLALKEGLHSIRFERTVIGEHPLPAADNTFDLLTSGLMLCHLPDLRAGVAECARVLRPGGSMVLSDFHPATQAFGWRTDFITPDGRMLLPNVLCTRQDNIDAVTSAGCSVLEVKDIGLDGLPYGDVSEAAIKAKGLPPLCLVIWAQK